MCAIGVFAMRKLAEPEQIMRRTVRCDWICRHCGQQFGSENIAYYCATLPDIIKPTWFFAAMTLLDHLRDCRNEDYTGRLAGRYGADFLSHPQIYNWFNEHALVEKRLIEEEELDDQQGRRAGTFTGER